MRYLPVILALALAAAFASQSGNETRIPLTISGGHETDPRDHGRPVTLIAHALGVPDDVFRTAFSGVKPAAAGTEPDPEQVRRNKSVLMGALSRYGVTNDRLDQVSNYYRYPPGPGNMWKTRPAAAYLTFANGAPAAVITDAGSGYSAPPAISAPGHPEIRFQASLALGTDLAKNGSIAAITIAPHD